MAKAKTPRKPRDKKPFNRHKWLISQLRRLTMKYPPAIEAINAVKTTYYIKSKKGTDVKRVKFVCELCGAEDLKRTEVDLDHIIPVVGSDGFQDVGTFVDRLFCERSNFQLICKTCHLAKSASENLARRDNK